MSTKDDDSHSLIKARRLMSGDNTLYANPIVASNDRRGRITPKSAFLKASDTYVELNF